MTRWAAQIPHTSLTSLGALRLLDAVDACATKESIWLRCDELLHEEDVLRLRQVPGARRYEITEHNELIPLGSLVPSGTLPDGPWIALTILLAPQLSTQPLPASSIARMSLSLARDDHERP